MIPQDRPPKAGGKLQALEAFVGSTTTTTIIVTVTAVVTFITGAPGAVDSWDIDSEEPPANNLPQRLRFATNQQSPGLSDSIRFSQVR